MKIIKKIIIVLSLFLLFACAKKNSVDQMAQLTPEQ